MGLLTDKLWRNSRSWFAKLAEAQRSQGVQKPAFRLVFALCLFCLGILGGSTQAAEYLTPNDVVLPSETASAETVLQSAGKQTIRLLGLDVFPHAAISGMYDDNVLISHTNAISDLELSVLPGATLVAGDVSTAFPGSVTLEQLRDLLSYSLVDDTQIPSRFIGADFTPSFNLFLDNGRFDNIDYNAGMTAGYTFSRLSIGLDQDFSRVAIKDNEVGARVTRIMFDTKLKLRYMLTDRTLFEVNGRLLRPYYGEHVFQGYYEFRNEDWVDRKIGGKLDVGLGAAFGFVYPDVTPSQTYQQLLARGIYHISGKLDIRAQFGGELREYGGGTSDTFDPVVQAAAIYQFRPPTTFTFEVHRRDQPSPEGYYNYQTFGFSAGAREKLFDRLSASLTAGYDNVDYVRLGSGAILNRSDSYYSVNVGLAYEVDQHLTATLFYIYQADASNQAQFTYNDNMVGLRVGWRY